MRRGKLMQALEETGADITPEDKNLPDMPVDETEEVIQDVVVTVNELNEYDASIEDAEGIAETLSEMAELVQPAVDSDDGITPQEADVIEVVTEHFKTLLGYTKAKKTIPTLESFGGTMSKVEATKLAIEGLTELVSEVNVEIEKSYINRYSDQVKIIEANDIARKSLLTTLTETSIKAKEFFKTKTYSDASSFVGNELVGGYYTKNIFVNKEAIDGKMPVASVLSGLQLFKLNNCLGANVSKLSNHKSIIESFINSNDVSVESIKSTFNQLKETYDNLITDASATVDDSNSKMTRQMKFPLSNISILLTTYTKEYLEKNNYWDCWTEITKDLNDTGKLLAMSEQETVTVLDTALEVLQNNEYSEVAADYITKLIALRKLINDKSIRTTESSEEVSGIINDINWMIDNACMGVFGYMKHIVIIELRIIKALNDYVLDSIGYLSTRTPA